MSLLYRLSIGTCRCLESWSLFRPRRVGGRGGWDLTPPIPVLVDDTGVEEGILMADVGAVVLDLSPSKYTTN